MCIARLQTQPRYDGTYPIDSDSLPIVLDGGSPEGDSELVTGEDRHEDVNGMTHDNTADDATDPRLSLNVAPRHVLPTRHDRLLLSSLFLSLS